MHSKKKIKLINQKCITKTNYRVRIFHRWIYIIFFMIKNKIAMIDIQGGFGNQLFQFSYAKYLEKKQFKVFINLNNFKRVANERNSIITNRELLIPVSYFGFKEIKYSLFFVFDLVDKLKLNNFDKFRNNTSLKKVDLHGLTKAMLMMLTLANTIGLQDIGNMSIS